MIVLAAGYGTRLGQAGRDSAKALLEIDGEPILSRLVALGEALSGIDEILVVHNDHFAADFEDWQRKRPPGPALTLLNDGSTASDNKLGALGDLAFALERPPTRGHDLLVMAGDHLLDVDLVPALEVFLRYREPTLILRERDPEPAGKPSRYNEVKVDPEGRVTRFIEKPEKPESPFAAIALYFFPENIGERLGVYLADGGNPDAPGYFVAWLVGETTVRAVPIQGTWHDIGDPESLAAARGPNRGSGRLERAEDGTE